MQWYLFCLIGITISFIGFFGTTWYLKRPGKKIQSFLNEERFDQNYQKALFFFKETTGKKVTHELLTDKKIQKEILIVTIEGTPYFFIKKGQHPWKFFA